MATILLHAAASQPVDVNVEVTANGVKIPIGLDQPGKLSERAGMHLKKPTGNFKGPAKFFEDNAKNWLKAHYLLG